MRAVKSTAIVVVLGVSLGLMLLPATAAAAPSLHEETGPGGINLANWKAGLTTVILLVALAQFFGQAVVRGWIKATGLDKKRLAALHRPGGIIAFTLTLVVLLLCLYVMFGPTGYGLEMLAPTRVVLHAVLGTLLLLVLAAKAVISNFARQQLRLNAPLGIAALVLSLGVFLASVVPHVFRLG